jgi:hypothetical protein
MCPESRRSVPFPAEAVMNLPPAMGRKHATGYAAVLNVSFNVSLQRLELSQQCGPEATTIPPCFRLGLFLTRISRGFGQVH